MIKAHSLLYAVYICLIIALVCSALLYFANVYNQLNLYYNIQEELYIQNRSVVNFALGNGMIPEVIQKTENTEIEGNYTTAPYGFFSVLSASTWAGNDTVTSVHLAGASDRDKTAVYLTNLSKALSYSGTVKLIGNRVLPAAFIETAYMNNRPNTLITEGKITISEVQLPQINPAFKKIFETTQNQKAVRINLNQQPDSLYYNSFSNETKELYIDPILAKVNFKGNFILRSEDSIRVQKNTFLEDVILIAPKITFESGFTGTVQAFATKGIELEEKVILNYPSVLALYNERDDESNITIKKESIVAGAVVLFGTTEQTIDKNNMKIEEGLIVGDIYCTGKLFLKSKVYGSIYTNRFFIQTPSSSYDNTISDIEINADKRPDHFISVPLFDIQNTTYGILKKVL